MRLVKDGLVMVTDNVNVISAFKEAGYVEEAEPVKKAEAPKTKKAPTKTKA